MFNSIRRMLFSFFVLGVLVFSQAGMAYAKDEVVQDGVVIEEIQKAKGEIKILYEELLQFKDKASFHENGFDGKFKEGHDWKAKVDDLEKSMAKQEGHSDNVKAAPGKLAKLGHEYKESKGKENEEIKQLTEDLNAAIR